MNHYQQPAVFASTGKKSPLRYWIFLAMSILFIGPMVAAWSFYAAGDNFVPSTLNWGKLIRPPVSITKIQLSDDDNKVLALNAFHKKWLLVMVEPKECGTICQESLYKMRQVRLALGKNMDRLMRIVASFKHEQTALLNDVLKKAYPGMAHIYLNKNKYDTLAQSFPLKKGVDNGLFFLVDPMGNIMMEYSLDIEAKGLYQDLKRLLKVSQIG